MVTAIQEKLFGPSEASQSLAYTPVIKDLAGELAALADVPDDIRQVIAPVIELNPIASRRRTDQVIRAVRRACGQDALVFLGLAHGGNDNERAATISSAAEAADARGLMWQPAVWMGHPGADYDLALRYARAKTGGLVRVAMRKRAEALITDIEGFVSASGGKFLPLALLLDFGQIGPTDHRVSMERLLREVLTRLPKPGGWTSVGFAASSIPTALTQIPEDGADEFPRVEWAIYESIRQSSDGLARLPIFGDYTVVKPSQQKRAGRGIAVPVNLRYTLETSTRIIKGRELSPDQDHSVFRDLVRDFVRSDKFAGATYSAGDARIHQLALQRAGIGTTEQWRRADVCHHITYVGRQVMGTSGIVGAKQKIS